MCKMLALDFYGPKHASFLNSLIPYNFCMKGDLGFLFHVSVITTVTITTYFLLVTVSPWQYILIYQHNCNCTVNLCHPHLWAWNPAIFYFDFWHLVSFRTTFYWFYWHFWAQHPVGALKVLNERHLFITAAISRPGLFWQFFCAT